MNDTPSPDETPSPLAVPAAGGELAVGPPVRARLPRSRFGPAGALAKRIVERLIRFSTRRQEIVNAGLEARVRQLEEQLAEVAAMRRELTGAALDFGAIADRMNEFENVRRVVERSAAFRDEVRRHRADLIEVRQQLGALSARVTLLQRETAPVRTMLEEMRDEVAAVRGDIDRVAGLAADVQTSLARGAARVDALAADIELGASNAAAASDRIGALKSEIEQVQSATARDLAQRSSELRAVVEEVERRIGTAYDPAARGVPVAERLDAHDARLEAIRSRLGDIAGALNVLQEGAMTDPLISENGSKTVEAPSAPNGPRRQPKAQ